MIVQRVYIHALAKDKFVVEKLNELGWKEGHARKESACSRGDEMKEGGGGGRTRRPQLRMNLIRTRKQERETAVATYLFVHDAHLGPGVTTVLFEDGREVPPLELAEAANDGARAMASEAAHDEDGVRLGVDEQLERLENHFFRDRIPGIGSVQDAEMVEGDLARGAELDKGRVGVVGGEEDDAGQEELVEEGEAGRVRLAAAVEVLLDHAKVGRRDEHGGGPERDEGSGEDDADADASETAQADVGPSARNAAPRQARLFRPASFFVVFRAGGST